MWWNEKGPHRLIGLDALSPASGTTWEGLEGVVLLEKVCHWKWALRIQKSSPDPVTHTLTLHAACGSDVSS